jgi:hypothetical protein
MRYSRFKASIDPNESLRRNRATTNKSRVTKSKKDPKPKKDTTRKSVSAVASPNVADPPVPSPNSIRKQERPNNPFETRLTPGFTPGPMPTVATTPTPYISQPRFLTPCSETDAFAPSQGPTSSPASNNPMNSPSPFDFPMPNYGPDMAVWRPAAYPYHPAYPFEPFGMECAPPQQVHHHSEQFEVPYHAHTEEPQRDSPPVKHEEHCGYQGWDS